MKIGFFCNENDKYRILHLLLNLNEIKSQLVLSVRYMKIGW